MMIKVDHDPRFTHLLCFSVISVMIQRKCFSLEWLYLVGPRSL